MKIKQLLSEYSDWQEGSRYSSITHPSFESLEKKLQNYLGQVLRVLTLNDFQKPPEEYNEKMINSLSLFEIGLRENSCTDQKLQLAIEEARIEIQEILDLPHLTDAQYTWFRENGLNRSEILQLVKENNLSSVWNPIYENLDTYKEVLAFDNSRICALLKLREGVKKLKYLIDFCLNYNDEIINFRDSSRLTNLVSGKDFMKKLEYLSNDENLKRLKNLHFNGDDILMMFARGWRLKMNYFEDEKNMQWLLESGFDGSSLYYIIMFPEWKKKLDYLNSYTNRMQKFKSAGFTPSEIAKLLYPQKWRSEIKYLEDESYLKRLKESGMTCSQIAQGWKDDYERPNIKRGIR